MGYAGNSRLSFEYEGEDSEGEGLWDHLVSFWRNMFWSSTRKANYVWGKFLRSDLKPPRPIPDTVIIRVNGFLFVLRDGKMVNTGRGDVPRGLGP